MIKQLRRSATLPRTARPSTLNVPLRRVVLCLDCERCFEIGPDCCGACGSETWVALARFLELRGESSVGQVIVVSRQRPRLHERLKRAFAGNKTIQVVIDRRRDEPAGINGLRRPLDRRSSDEVRKRGWTVVRRAVPLPS